MLKRKFKNNLFEYRARLSIVAFGIFSLVIVSPSFAADVDRIIDTGKKTTENSSRAQRGISKLADETDSMSYRYESVLIDIESTKDFNASLEKHILSQQEGMNSLRYQMGTIDATSKGVNPLMREMIASLRRFIELDIPFRQEERLQRVDELNAILNRSDVQIAEKYRNILKAYDDEVDYGSKFVAYQDLIEINGIDTQVDFLSVGRILLAYLTLDGKQAGLYDRDSGEFVPLDEKYIRSLKTGIKMARGHASRELISLPIPAAQGVN